MIRIARLDHPVLTVADIAQTPLFYSRGTGHCMTPQRFVSGGVERHALAFGSQKFDLNQSDRVLDPNVRHAAPGSADLCLITDKPIADVIAHLQACDVDVLLGPVRRTGAVHSPMSVYFHDPDENLVEVSNALKNREGVAHEAVE